MRTASIPELWIAIETRQELLSSGTYPHIAKSGNSLFSQSTSQSISQSIVNVMNGTYAYESWLGSMSA